MRTLVVLPGRAPHWVAGHGRDVAHRLVDQGSVMVAFTHHLKQEAMLPGQSSRSSVLGHSLSGQPLWTGRLAVALGLRARRDLSIVVMWPGASELLALWATFVSRVRRELVVLDVLEGSERDLDTVRGALRWATCRLATMTLRRPDVRRAAGERRRVLVLCGHDRELARLALSSLDGMAQDAAQTWAMQINLDASAGSIAVGGHRQRQSVVVHEGAPSARELRHADAVIANFAGPDADIVRVAVLTGGAGVLVGSGIAERVPRCHDGVWLAKRDAASMVVALEASTGSATSSPVPVGSLRDWGAEVVAAALGGRAGRGARGAWIRGIAA